MLAFSCVLFALSALPADASGARESGATVHVAAESVAHGERLTLGDIADVRAIDLVTAERLRAIPLGYAPNVGAIRELSRDRIALAVAAAGFTSDAVRIEAPAIAIIRRAAQSVDPALIQRAVETAVLSELRFEGATARLSKLELPASIEVASGAVEVRARVGGVRNLFVPFTVSIEFWADGRITRRLSATAQVEAFAPVLVAAHDLSANARLRKEDVITEVRRLDRDPSLYLRDVGRLRGLSMSQNFPRGEAITSAALVAGIIIKPGDTVLIVSESNALSIAVTGEARGAGRVGDRIQVKNIQSGTLLQATVVDEGLVHVRF